MGVGTVFREVLDRVQQSSTELNRRFRNQPILGYTSERLDPLLIPANAVSDRARLDLHVERYRLAAEYVHEAHVVDCACGTGFGSATLMQAGARSVDGVDLDREALEYARSRHALPGITFFEADALRFVPSFVPSVWVSVDTMERLPHPAAYIKHVSQLLPQGGRFIASVPVTVTTDSDQHHLHDFTRASFRALLHTHGFKEERTLEQTRRFTFADLLSRSPGLRPREHRQGLLVFYARRPRVFGQRVAHTMTRGFVHEYLTVVAVKS